MAHLVRLAFTMLVAVAIAACGDNKEAVDECVAVDDGNACTEDSCVDGNPSHSPIAAGTACAVGVCNGTGACVGCLDDANCTAPLECSGATSTCVAPTCTDTEKNGDETDVDCGGACAPVRRCGDGLACGDGADCQSGVCSGSQCQAPACGDGVPQSGETCDDGNGINGDGCDDGPGGNCRPTGCGNGVPAGTEECDDANSVDGDGCDNNCTTTRCGNGVIAGAEVCDDNNSTVGDGCSATCAIETGFTCTQIPSVCVGTCGDGIVVTGEGCDDPSPAESGDGCSITCAVESGFSCSGSPSSCATTCGDGIRAGGEGCDDAPPAESNDGCSASCFVEPGFICVGTPSLCFGICGDGLVRGTEECDDPSPAENGDGCSAACRVEVGFACAGEPSSCTPRCGDGLVLVGEACDDAPPAESGDGCSATCTVEAGFTCSGAPSNCATTCGDGIPAGTEQCDDTAPAENGDGCSAACTIEPGFTCSGTPSACLATCGDGLVRGTEACDDAPPAEDGDGCSAACTVEPGFVCTGEPSSCELTCGNGVLDPGEGCDDGGLAAGDGCSAACAVEFGFTCSGSPSDCTATCGDGLVASIEQCDDAPPAENGDGCSAGCTVEPGFNCTGTAPSTCSTRCGDGVRAGTEQCDDGCLAGTPGVCEAADNGDGCTQACTFECGDGVLNAALEQCDDGNRNAGDGCSPTCAFEVVCAGTDVLVQIRSTDVPRAIPDNLPAGVDSVAVVPLASQGAVRKAVVGFGRITHTLDADLDITLRSPVGRVRSLVADRGGSGDNFVGTILDDAAPQAISVGTAPFTGRFRPEQTISSIAGFAKQNAAGLWTLNIVDDLGADTGTLEGWTLSLCVDPTAVCGNGTTDTGEECDDGNQNDTDACNNACGVTSGCGDGLLVVAEECDDDNRDNGDGCSATCGIELTCGAGELPVLLTSTTSVAITDNNTFNSFTQNVTTTGGVRRAVVFLRSITHGNTGQLDIQLASPSGVIRNLSDDNGTGANYVQTAFVDGAPTLITAGASPFSGIFRPEATLTATPTVDFFNTNANGFWDLQIRDDTTTSLAGTLDGWTLGLCVDTASFCGNGVTDPSVGEECDDGNSVDTDACSNRCETANGCGDGDLDAGEECDDDNVFPGDGCSEACALDIGCELGETAVVVRSAGVTPIIDEAGGVLGAITFSTPGVVRRVIPTLTSITHTDVADLDIYLMSPFGPGRKLVDDETGVNYRATSFSDEAANLITAAIAVAPYTGTFRPEETLEPDFLNQSTAGTWLVRIGDDAAGDIGTLDSWALAVCVDTSVTRVCGNGVIEAVETCDDGNLVAGDGCSPSCQLELVCTVGTPVIVKSTSATEVIRDANATGTSMAISVPTPGVVRRALVVFGSISHPFLSDLDISLISPASTVVDVTSDNGSSGDHYVSTIFDDTAPAVVPASATGAPFRGRFKPDSPLSAVNGQAAAGNWTLRVVDDAGIDGGAFQSWVLGLCVE